MTLHEKIKLHKLTKDIVLFEEIEDEYVNNAKKCIKCNHSIVYPNTFFRISKANIIKYEGSSFKTVKIVNNKQYSLVVCDKCLSKKFKNYDSLNKSRIFNRLNDITKFAFNITDNDFNIAKETSFGAGVSKCILIKRHGEKEGLERWEEYKQKQAKSNTFEYKQEKYGWSKTQFNEFNKKRAVTINNLISRYGEKEGLERWDAYIKQQRYTCTFDYFIHVYGKDVGFLKWNNFISSKFFKNVNYSKKSQELFESFELIFNKYKTYYALKNGEFNKRLNGHIVFLDYYILELKIAIEYNGNKFHANPDFYNDYDKPNPFTDELAKDIKQRDLKRYNQLYDELGIKTLVIWENDNINLVKLEKIVNLLYKSNIKYGEYRKL
jgi:hypothetical protein